METPLRQLQLQLVEFVVAHLRGANPTAPSMSLVELQQAGLATGMTALVAELGGDRFADELQPYLAEQRQQVAARVERFAPVISGTLQALHAAGVPATPVKGAELVNGIWPVPTARPMSDVDVIVPVEMRAQAAAALIGDGLAFVDSSPLEDVFLAWGDGSTGRTDGESADHNGRVELHPGWNEFLHGYVVNGFAVDCHTAPGSLVGESCARLSLAGLTAHVVGHLSSTVVRCEVRALNVVDAWFCHRAGVDWNGVEVLLDTCDARLAGPGLWLIDRLLPGTVDTEMVKRQLDRLPRTSRRRLESVAPEATFRDPRSRTTLGWRQAFAAGAMERAAVLQQMTRSKRVRR